MKSNIYTALKEESNPIRKYTNGTPTTCKQNKKTLTCWNTWLKVMTTTVTDNTIRIVVMDENVVLTCIKSMTLLYNVRFIGLYL